MIEIIHGGQSSISGDVAATMTEAWARSNYPGGKNDIGSISDRWLQTDVNRTFFIKIEINSCLYKGGIPILKEGLVDTYLLKIWLSNKYKL